MDQIPKGGIDSLLEDLSPQLGGDLDVNDNKITNATGNVVIKLESNDGSDKTSFTDSDDAEVAAIDSNGNITTAGTVDGRGVAADGTKLDTVETNADVTDATNVNAAGAVMNSDTSTAAMNFVIDEDNMASNSATKTPTQQSVKTYVDNENASDVTASSTIADNRLMRGDGGSRGAQQSVITVSDAGAISGAGIDGATNTLTNIGFTAFDTDVADTMKFVDGAFLDDPAVTSSSNGTVITLSLEKEGGGDLRIIFSTGVLTYDTTPAATISLTAGSDTSPTMNYVYVLESTGVLTVNTSDWPAAEHAPVATVNCQSAASYQTDGPYKLHAWTNHLSNGDGGHLDHINRWIREQNATYKSGVGQTLTITPNGGGVDNVIFTTVSGVVHQLHDHTFPAFSGTPDIYTVNDSATAYNIVTDLSSLLTDSTGGSMSNRRFSLVIWGVVSEDTGDCKLFVNLPSGTYNSNSAVVADASKFSNYTIPGEFTGTGFLISELKLRHQTSSSGTWTSVSNVDLRGTLPSISAGGGAAAGSEFADNVFRIQDDADSTKEVAFQASGIATGTTRTVTVPDKDGTMAMLSDIVGVGDMLASTYDAAAVSEQLAGLTATQTLTNKTLTAPVINSPTGIDADDIADAATTNKFVTAADITVLGNTSGANSGDESAASLTVAGVVELATIAETDTGTDATRAITPDGLNGSALQTKVNGIETAADVTDETNVVAALDGATLTAVTVAATDKVVIQDADDSDKVKTATAQSIADLGGGGAGLGANTFTALQTMNRNDLVTTIAVSGAVTSTANGHHLCTGTSYTITLTAGSTVGEIQKFTVLSTTGAITLDGNSSELIDGVQTLDIPPNSSHSIMWDGLGWRSQSEVRYQARAPDVILEHQETSGTDAGGLTSGSYVTRPINIEVRDQYGICSLTSDQFTLDTGVYYIEAFATSNYVQKNKLRLYNATGTTVLLLGVIDQPDSGGSNSVVCGYFAIAASQALELQQRCANTVATYGMGQAASFGDTEVYLHAEIWRVS